jgi:dihydroorotate dehydrogenase electron transfer subunit
VSGQGSPGAHLGRRLLTVTGMEELGAYRVLRAVPTDPAGGGWEGEPAAGWAPVPGQFAMLATVERWGGGAGERPYLPRAFSIARLVAGESHFLLEDVGPGTRRLCELHAGDQLWALGPLGHGFQLPDDGRRALLVGGGVGIAPLAILQDTLAAAAPDTEVTVLLGFRDGPRAAGAALLDRAHVATDDGSSGHHGLVTDLLAAEIERDPHAVVYACGPAGMLEGVRVLCAGSATPAQLALEAGMACGFGACFGCVVPRRGGGYLRVCLDGPVVDAAELDHVDAHAGAAA